MAKERATPGEPAAITQRPLRTPAVAKAGAPHQGGTRYRRGAPGTPEYRTTRHKPKTIVGWFWVLGWLKYRSIPQRPSETRRPEGDHRQVRRQAERSSFKRKPIAHPKPKVHLRERSRWEGHRIRRAARLERPVSEEA